MATTTTKISEITLHGTKKGLIIVSDITEPYGKGTNDVVSIGITLNGKDVEWKSHIPYENLDELIEKLTQARDNKK